jgi:hypothetical protein
MSDQLTNFNGTRSESAPKVKAETVTGESRQAGGNPAGDTSLPEDVLAEMERLHGRRYERRWLDLIETHGKALLACARELHAAKRACYRNFDEPLPEWMGAIAVDYNAAQKRIAELEAQLEQAGIEGNDLATQLMCWKVDAEKGKKRIAELEAVHADYTRSAQEHLEYTRRLEALLDRVEHTSVPLYNLTRCKADCPRCEWERMKGGGRSLYENQH